MGTTHTVSMSPIPGPITKDNSLPKLTPVLIALLAALLFCVRPLRAHDPSETQSGQPKSAGEVSSEAQIPDQMEDMPGMDMGNLDMSGMDHGAMEHDTGAMAHQHGAASHDHITMPTPDSGLVRILLSLTAVLAGALLLAGWFSLRKSDEGTGRKRTDLLQLPVLGRFIKSRYFLGLLITPTMLIFAFIVVAGLFGEQTTANPAILLTWILWWPAVVFTFFLLGRIWCAFCPFGYMGELAQKLFSWNKKTPAILKNMWWRMGLFLALTWITTMWALDRWPQGTALLALTLTLGAVTLAFVYEKRVFCRYVCPVGGIFGLYSMTAPLRLTVKDQHICRRDCKEKNCSRACPWYQFPPAMDRGAECSLCMDCARACPHDNIALETQPFASDLVHFQPHRKSLDELSAIAAVLGVALLQTVVMLNAWNGWEARIASWLGLEPGRLLYTIIYATVGLVVPLLLLGTVVWTSRRLGQKPGSVRADFFRSLRNYAYCFLPLGLALHAAHNFHHLLGEGSAMWIGLRNWFAQFTGWTVLATNATPAAPGPNTMYVLQWLALMGGLYLAYRVTTGLVRRDIDLPQRRFAAALPILLFAVAYTVMNLAILSAAMAHRH